MNAFHEKRESFKSSYPVDVFISDNQEFNIKVIPHWHEFIEILYVMEGKALQQINDKRFLIEKNDIVVINCGDNHSIECVKGENVRILVLQFSPGIMNTDYSNLFESKYILSFLNSKQSHSRHIADVYQHSRSIFNLIMGIYEEYSRKESGYEIYIKGYLYQLIACLLRNGIIDMYQPGMQEVELKRLDPLFKYIENHYAEKIDLHTAANTVNLSYFYFSRYFKKVTGRNFKEYIDYVRVCEAEKLLATWDTSISRVAYEVGFTNVCSFNKVYKRIRNYSPGVFIKAKTAKN